MLNTVSHLILTAALSHGVVGIIVPVLQIRKLRLERSDDMSRSQLVMAKLGLEHSQVIYLQTLHFFYSTRLPPRFTHMGHQRKSHLLLPC